MTANPATKGSVYMEVHRSLTLNVFVTAGVPMAFFFQFFFWSGMLSGGWSWFFLSLALIFIGFFSIVFLSCGSSLHVLALCTQFCRRGWCFTHKI